LNAVHLFFPTGKAELIECFDWETSKRSQLNTFRFLNNAERSTVYLIGRASVTGSVELNRQLSAARMQSVYNYLRYDLKIPCPNFRGAWMGKEILQFTFSDAAYLKLPPQEFRGDELVLNQAVHVFAVPCANLGL
jgi:outer membrane protein OmpA-like peptidoglycan-associated protein